MRKGWMGAAGAAVVAGLAIATAGSLSAQQNQSTPAQPSIMVDEPPAVAPPQQPAQPPQQTKRSRAPAPALQSDPDLDAEDQLAPSQVAQPMPAAVPAPSRTRTHTAAVTAQPAAAEKRSRANAGHLIVACSGAFAKDSSHLKLAMTYDTKNVDFTQVDAGSGKAMATIVYPKDPKRRLEVWWAEPALRKDTYLVVINGHSTWAAPEGLRLGLNLAELEKLNRKPFKLKGFDKENVASVSDWDGGALAALPGGCKAGVLLHADAKAAADALAAFPADHEFLSTDPALRAVTPTVSEILIGY